MNLQDCEDRKIMQFYKIVCVLVLVTVTVKGMAWSRTTQTNNGRASRHVSCRSIPCTATTTTSTTQISSTQTRSDSVTPTMPSTISSSSSSNNTTTAPTTVSTPSSFTTSTSSTTGNTSTSAKAVVTFADFSRGSSNAATAAGISVAMALAVAAAVIVFVLRKKGKLCFAITKGSKLENPDDNHHISLAREESKSKAHYQSPLSLGQLEAHEYSVLEKDGFEQHIKAITSENADVHDYFVLEKQTSDISNGNSVPVNEIHPYFVLEKQGYQPVHETPSNETNPYSELEKQTTSNSQPINKEAALESEHDDATMYQEIDSNDTYADIDDSRQGNNDYDYTNKTFRDSETEISGSVYNHLNATCNAYDHLGKGLSNVRAMANNYNITSSVGMK